MQTNDQNHEKTTACLCPACTAVPAKTYTLGYMEECLARWFVNANPQQRQRFLEALHRQPGGGTRLKHLEAVAQELGLCLDAFRVVSASSNRKSSEPAS